MRFNQNEDSGVFEKLLVLIGIVMMGGTIHYTFNYHKHHQRIKEPVKNEIKAPQKIGKNKAIASTNYAEELKKRMR